MNVKCRFVVVLFGDEKHVEKWFFWVKISVRNNEFRIFGLWKFSRFLTKIKY